MKLFELTQQYRELELLADSDEIPPEVIADTLEGLKGEFEDKAVAVAKFVLGMEAEAEAIEEASKAMKLRADRIAKRAENVKMYLLLQMQIVQATRISTHELTISRKNNPKAVQYARESDVPEIYWVQPDPPPKKIDKRKLKDALEMGAKIEGVYLESGERVEIKL
jgi:hypothetical protein